MIADLAISSWWIIGGGALIRRKPLGYVLGLGLLFAASMLFIGLIVLLMSQPLLTGKPLMLADVLVVALMGLFFFLP